MTGDPGQVNEPAPTRETQEFCEVSLSFQTDPGSKVSVVGSFNDWDSKRTPMTEVAPGDFRVTLRLPPGEYEYKFVRNGRWQADPQATEWAPNPFGSLNSRLTVPRS
ncbi:MAG: isoamylase early set domain-containing protein [Planctomycetota bacterium]